MDKSIVPEYEQFLLNNRVSVNKYLNIMLWLFVLTGPAIAIGVHSGTFPDITYMTCIVITVVVTTLSLIHRIMLIKIPKAAVTCLFALVSLVDDLEHMADQDMYNVKEKYYEAKGIKRR
ncbi:MAG: hypothetical protein K5745_07310 [Saccharofermentans sp.]|nr:hypothetical protein [Saccharofermentans sp.]